MPQFLTFANLRPPVCVNRHGGSPLRGKQAKATFSLANGHYTDKNGFPLQKEFVAAQMTDDGRLADVRWNKRHHSVKSQFNQQNSDFYKVRTLAVLTTAVGIFRQANPDKGREGSEAKKNK